MEEVVGKAARLRGPARRVSGRRREGYGSGHGAPFLFRDERAAAPPTDPSLRSRRVCAETLADSSAFSVETKFGKDAKSAFDAGAAGFCGFVGAGAFRFSTFSSAAAPRSTSARSARRA